MFHTLRILEVAAVQFYWTPSWEPIGYSKIVWSILQIGKHAKSAMFFSHLMSVIIIYLSFLQLITEKIATSTVYGLLAVQCFQYDLK